MSVIKVELEELMHKSAEKLGLKNYDITIDFDAQRGEGFLSEFYLTSILDKDTNTVHNLAVKKAFKNAQKREEMFMKIVYSNEISFYSELYPKLKEFQDSKNIQNPFHEIPEFVFANNEELKEALVMQNLKKEGYQLLGFKEQFDDQQIIDIFKIYGKFHALTFSFKDQFPEECEKYKKLKNIFQYFKGITNENLIGIWEKIMQKFDPVKDKGLIEAFSPYMTKPLEILMDAIKEKGEYCSLIHGDTRSNNVMFREGADIKLLDFQLIYESSPIKDLSYLFYVGAKPELYDNLNRYLEIYYEQFSKNVRELGSKPEELLPFDSLKRDWKKFSQFGLIFGLMVTRIQLIDADTLKEVTKDDEVNIDQDFVDKTDKDEFARRGKLLLEHFYKSGYFINQ